MEPDTTTRTPIRKYTAAGPMISDLPLLSMNKTTLSNKLQMEIEQESKKKRTSTWHGHHFRIMTSAARYSRWLFFIEIMLSIFCSLELLIHNSVTIEKQSLNVLCLHRQAGSNKQTYINKFQALFTHRICKTSICTAHGLSQHAN